MEFQMAEFFAGRGNLSRCMRLSGIPTASLDLLYPAVPRKSNPNRHTINAMDMNTRAGFAPFGRGRLSHFSDSLVSGVSTKFLTGDICLFTGVTFVLHGDSGNSFKNNWFHFLSWGLDGLWTWTNLLVCWIHHHSWFECGIFDS